MPHREQLEYELKAANRRIEELERIIGTLLEEFGRVEESVEAAKRINNTYKKVLED